MKIRRICIGLICCLCATVLVAQPVQWQPQKDYVDVTEQVAVLEDTSGQWTIDTVAQPNWQQQFQALGKAIINLGFTESVYWMKIPIVNNTSDSLVLEVAHAFLPITDLYYFNNGHWIQQRAGYQIPLNQKKIRHHFQVFKLPSGEHTVYIKLVSNSHPLRFRIYTEGAYDIKTYRQRLVFGFYIGFMFFVILSNLFFYFSLRNRMYLFYAGIVLVYISYASMVMDGFILYFIPNVDLMFWYTTIPTIGVPLQMIYALVFLEVHKYHPKLYRYIQLLVVYFIAYAILNHFLPLTVVLAINTVHALISFFTMGYLGYATGKRGNRLGYYFALAYFIYFLLVLTEATYIQIGQPAYFFELSHVALATLIEAFLLSFLLSKRFEFEKEENDRLRHEAQQQLLEKTLENERIVKEQNLTLENRVAERTKELHSSLEELKQAQARLIQSEKLASLGELTAGIAHEIQNPLNFVNNFSELNKELLEEMQEAVANKDFEEAVALSKTVQENEEKISHHGKRADAIVKGMLQHSRLSTGEKELTDINAMCDEYLRLAYHGLRAKDKTFNAGFTTHFDNNIGQVMLLRQEMGRVLLNLINNAFYAVREKSVNKLYDATAPYQPMVEVTTHLLENGSVQIRVIDNGMGIPNKIKDKIFQPFFTTKPTGQGTGLGLSLSYDIVTNSHGGELSVSSIDGKGTTFTITLQKAKQ